MTDIFEIVGVNAELRLPHSKKTYRFKDPEVLKKIQWMKDLRDFNKKAKDQEEAEQMLQSHYLARRYVQLYVPDLTDHEIEKMGQHAFEALHQKITNLAGERFGAYVTKIDEEKKPLATTPA